MNKTKRRTVAANPQVPQETPKKLGDCNLWLLDNQELCDVYFLIGNEKIGCHKLFLMSRSTVFQSMFADRWDKKDKSEVELVDCDHQYFKLFLKFIYADQFVSSAGDAIHLLALADKYDVPLLKEKCQDLIQRDISLEDSVAVYQAARSYNLPELQKSAGEIMCENFDTLLKHQSFFQADEETLTALLKKEALNSTELEIFQGIMRWVTKKKSTTALKKLIPLIRFPVMTADEFSRHVVPTKVLTDEETVNLFVFFHAEPTARDKLLKSNFSTVPRSPCKLLQVVKFYPGPQETRTIYSQSFHVRDFEETLRFYCRQVKPPTLHSHWPRGLLANQGQPASLPTKGIFIRTVKLRGPNPTDSNAHGHFSRPNIPTTEQTWKVSLNVRKGQDQYQYKSNSIVFQKSDITISNMKDTCVVVKPSVPITDSTWYFISVKFHSDVSVSENAADGFNPNTFCQLARQLNFTDGFVGQHVSIENGTSSHGDYIACVTTELGLSPN